MQCGAIEWHRRQIRRDQVEIEHQKDIKRQITDSCPDIKGKKSKERGKAKEREKEKENIYLVKKDIN